MHLTWLGRSQGRGQLQPRRALDVSRNVLNIERVRQVLDWTPSLSLTEGLERVVNELRRGRAGSPSA